MSRWHSELLADCDAQRDVDLEWADPERIAEVQLERLRAHLTYAIERSPWYGRALAGLDPRDLRDLASLADLPTTEKSDLTGANEAFRAAAPEDIVDVCLTSATTGDRPTVLDQTAEDLARLAYNEQTAFATAGLGESDCLLVGAALDRCFMAGLAYFMGGLRLGARCVRMGAGSPAQYWQTLRATSPSAVVSVPSLMRKVAEHAMESGEEPANAGVDRLIAIGEPTRGADMELLPGARRLEELWGAPVYSTYASTEIATTFCECETRRGGHLRPELIVAETIGEDGRTVAPGRPGEVIVTPLGVRGMPLVRFRTGDISFRIEEPCPCGRRTWRLGPVIGRRNQMLKYRGTTVFPQTLLAPLEGHPGVAGAYVEAHRYGDGTDRVVVCVSVRDASLDASALGDLVRASARVAPEVRLIDEMELNARVYGSGKRKRTVFFDLR